MKVITDSGDPRYLTMRASELIAESKSILANVAPNDEVSPEQSAMVDDCLRRAISLLALARQLEKK